MTLNGKNVLLAVCGSIAAYKSAFLVRLLIKEGANVKVIMTPSATEFIAPLTLATLSKNECLVNYTNEKKTNWNNHVELGLWADLMLIAPTTAGTVAKLSKGVCDNLLVGTYLSARCNVFIAPAMDEDMWHHHSTQENLKKLVDHGNIIIPVNDGELASGLVGKGRMAEPEEIIEFLRLWKANSKLDGKNILITAGPTYEPIDPVRFIGNHSTGKMGICIAEEAAERGANVTLVLGPSSLTAKNEKIKVISVVTGRDMLQSCNEHFEKQDVCIFSAAVADYTPVNPAQEKIKKKADTMTIELKKSIDIAHTFGKNKRNSQISVGFALETENELENAQQKLSKKNFNLIVLNSLKDKGAGFKHDTNKIVLIDQQNKVEKFELKSKKLVAKDILDKVEQII